MVINVTMKRYLIIIGILLALSPFAMGQMYSSKAQEKNHVAIGIKGGVNMPRLYYHNNTALQKLPQNDTITLMGGLFVDIPLGRYLWLSPEVAYLERGTDMTYQHQGSGADVHYALRASYADFRLPLEVSLPVKPYLQPYLVVGAEVGMRLFGKIHLDRSEPIAFDETIDVGDANLALIHAGAFAGVGIRSLIGVGSRHILLKLSATLHQGLLDSYGAAEKEGSVPATNVNAYQITGQRLPQGLEVTLGVAIPLEKQLDDACATFAKDRYRRRGSRGHLFGY